MLIDQLKHIQFVGSFVNLKLNYTMDSMIFKTEPIFVSIVRSFTLSTTTISDRLPHPLLFYVSNWPTDCMSVPSKKTFASKTLAENQPFSTKQDCHVAKHKKRALHYSDLC